ncbi:alpha/beta hydrolase [Mycoplasma sp. P36-A1]|uniref:alpha/beta hydrolase n=1 Tax=Mycoplasma sp. P36-A1 TaxID=3252900 RepID=UPI003C2CE464
MFKHIKKILLFISSAMAGYYLVVEFIPRIFLQFISLTFFRVPNDHRKHNYKIKNVKVKRDVSYESKYKRNNYDLYLSEQQVDKTPTLIWIHGGGFMGGDKVSMSSFASKVAQNGYNVVVLNYDLIPNVVYPEPLVQISEFFEYFKTHNKYNINMDNMFIAGDSAGAHYASQFIAIQNNIEYARMLNIAPVINSDNVRGLLLYCGFYDFIEVSNVHESNFIRYGFEQLGWMYYGERDWQNATIAKTSSIAEYIKNKYPATFLTDGNFKSFEEDTKRFAQKLQENGVEVHELYFDENKYITPHEYFRLMHTKPAKICFKETISFLDKYKL